MNTHYIYGRNTLVSLLETSPKRVQKVFMAEGLKPDKRLQAIQQLCKEEGIVLQSVPRIKIEHLAQQALEALEPEEAASLDKVVHQGVVAIVSEKPLLELHSWLASLPQPLPPCWVLALDGVSDPHNIGALLRVADGAGALGVLLPKHRSGGLSPIVSKTAAGADSTVSLVQVTNLSQALETLKKAGFWVVGTALEAKNGKTPVQPYHRLRYDMPTILVMGSEGEGLRSGVEKHCDFLVQIPMRGALQSLNVATATSVLAFHMALAFESLAASKDS